MTGNGLVMKWSLIAFVGLSAVFVREVRADSIEANARAIEERTGAKIRVPTWFASEAYFRKEVERTLAAMNTEAFYSVYAELSKQCGIGTKRIELGNSSFMSGDGVSIGVRNSGVAAALMKTSRACERIREMVEEINVAITPKKAVVEMAAVFSGRVRTSDVARWAAEIRSGKFQENLAQFEIACKSPVREIRIADLNRYTFAPNRVLEIRATDRPESVNATVKRAVGVCGGIYPALEDFNRRLALRHGLLFKLDPYMIYEGRVKESSVLAWLDFFKAGERHLDELREVAEKSAERGDTGGLRAPRPGERLIVVEFGHSWGYYDMAFFTTVFLMMDALEAPAILLAQGVAPDTELARTITAKYSMVASQPFHLMLEATPRIPAL